eukprot:m.216763 g.216763  ORF g.216763 m.216763 type:complete len:291 (+) comp39874_c0_seq46:199-1071(+)
MTMHAREEDDQDERIPSLTRLIHALHLGLLSISTQALFLVDHQVEPAFWGIAVILILNGIECVTFCGSKSKASSHKRDPHKFFGLFWESSGEARKHVHSSRRMEQNTDKQYVPKHLTADDDPIQPQTSIICVAQRQNGTETVLFIVGVLKLIISAAAIGVFFYYINLVGSFFPLAVEAVMNNVLLGLSGVLCVVSSKWSKQFKMVPLTAALLSLVLFCLTCMYVNYVMMGCSKTHQYDDEYLSMPVYNCVSDYEVTATQYRLLMTNGGAMIAFCGFGFLNLLVIIFRYKV